MAELFNNGGYVSYDHKEDKIPAFLSNDCIIPNNRLGPASQEALRKLRLILINNNLNYLWDQRD